MPRAERQGSPCPERSCQTHDHDPLSIEARQIAEVALGDDLTPELVEAFQRETVLALGELADRDNEAVDVLAQLGHFLPVRLGDAHPEVPPPGGRLPGRDDLVPEAHIEAAPGDEGFEMAGNLRTGRMQVGSDGPLKLLK